MGRQPASVRQVHRRLGVAGALEHAAGPGAQRKNMAGLHEIFRRRCRFGHDLDGARPVGGADAGGDAARGVHAHLKIRAEAFAVLLHHAVDAELVQPFGGGRHANQPAPESGHEIDGGGRDELPGHDQIAFIFAVGIIHDDDHFAFADVGDDGFNAVESFFHRRKQHNRPPFKRQTQNKPAWSGAHPERRVRRHLAADQNELTACPRFRIDHRLEPGDTAADCCARLADR